MNFFEWMQTDNFKKEVDRYAVNDKEMKYFKNDVTNRITKEAKIKIKIYQELIKNTPVPNSIFEIQYLGGDRDISELKDEFKDSWENVVYVILSERLPDNYCNKDIAQQEFDKMNYKHQCIANNKKNCMPQVNKKEHWDYYANVEENYLCLYVGKCEDKTRTRMTHHFEKITECDTYGLHLGEWWKDIKLTIFVMVFEEKMNKDTLNSIEGLLWDSYKPLFGRKGGK